MSKQVKPFTDFFAFLYLVAGFFVKLLHPVSVAGLENLPKHGALLVANHSSDWDPVLLVLALPRDYHLHVMAKEELFHNALLGWIIRKAGGFPVNRGALDIASVRTAMQVMKDGDNLLIFSEGTVIRNGIGCVDGLPPHAHSGAAMIGVRTGAVLIPVFVDGPKRLFHRTRIIFGTPRTPAVSGRRGTAEELQRISDDLLAEAYALGGQKVGGMLL